MALIVLLSLVMFILAWAQYYRRSPLRISRQVRRILFVLLCVACVTIAFYMTFASVEPLLDGRFTVTGLLNLLATAGWWCISYGAVMRKSKWARELWN